jgi:hypothetical protein
MDDITVDLKNMLVILCIGFNLCSSFINNVCLEPFVIESKIIEVLFNLISNWL